MPLKAGIVGLPNVGKSTLFHTLTKKRVDIANYPFATIDPNVGVVEVPDERLAPLARIVETEKIIPATVEFVDIAGLVKGAHEGKGLGNKFLAHIREVDLIVEVVRLFKDADISHVEGSVDPARDQRIIREELAAANLAQKPILTIFNSDGQQSIPPSLALASTLLLNMREESMEHLAPLVRKTYELLGLISFFSAGPKEVHAWTIPGGSSAKRAGRAIHSDFEEKFIRAVVINYKELLLAKSFLRARQLGLLRTEGKDYIVADGDVIEFRIGV